MEFFDGIMLGLAECPESFFQGMFDKPDSSRVHVRHDHGSLNLDKLRSVVKVNSNETRDTVEDKIKLEEDSFSDSSLIFAGCFDGAG